MNCREAQQQIFAERDGTLDAAARAAFAGHIAQCGGCRRIREELTAGLGAWRAQVAGVRIPDPEREWQAVRRVIRGGVGTGAERAAYPRRSALSWFAVPFTAAAAVAMALLIAPRPTDPGMSVPLRSQASRADSIEVPGSNASTMVYVDDKSGWLFVWASDLKQG
jgi:hypothetical protein